MDDNKPIGNIDWLEKYDLALEDKVSCDTVKCEREATYYAQVKCCNSVIFGCKECLQESYKTVLWMIKNNQFATCKSCDKKNDPRAWLSRPSKIKE